MQSIFKSVVKAKPFFSSATKLCKKGSWGGVRVSDEFWVSLKGLL
jgi:hypothetical protein